VLAICKHGITHVHWQLQEQVTSRLQTPDHAKFFIAVHESGIDAVDGSSTGA
jgi:hypothetical protein